MPRRRRDQDRTQRVSAHVVGVAKDAEGGLRFVPLNTLRARCRILSECQTAANYGEEASKCPVLDGPTTHRCGLRSETYSRIPRRRVAWKSTDARERTTLPTSKARAPPDSARPVCSSKRRTVRRWRSIQRRNGRPGAR